MKVTPTEKKLIEDIIKYTREIKAKSGFGEVNITVDILSGKIVNAFFGHKVKYLTKEESNKLPEAETEEI